MRLPGDEHVNFGTIGRSAARFDDVTRALAQFRRQEVATSVWISAVIVSDNRLGMARIGDTVYVLLSGQNYDRLTERTRDALIFGPLLEGTQLSEDEVYIMYEEALVRETSDSVLGPIVPARESFVAEACPTVLPPAPPVVEDDDCIICYHSIPAEICGIPCLHKVCYRCWCNMMQAIEDNRHNEPNKRLECPMCRLPIRHLLVTPAQLRGAMKMLDNIAD